MVVSIGCSSKQCKNGGVVAVGPQAPGSTSSIPIAAELWVSWYLCGLCVIGVNTITATDLAFRSSRSQSGIAVGKVNTEDILCMI